MQQPRPAAPEVEGAAVRRKAPNNGRPARVSEAAWAQVFPPDHEQVRLLAGRFFLFGHEPDDALRMALDEVDRLEWANGPHSERLARLQPLFPGGGRDVARRLPTAEVAAAVRAVVPTARRHWREIIAEADPERAAFRLRAWHAEPGCCLLCGNPGSDADKRFQGDVIHTACRPLMAAIGPAFGQLVLDEVLNIQNEMAQPQVIGIDPTADPDDSSTWL